MVRTFALVVLSANDNILDRFNLDLVSKPKGFGFELEMSTIVTDIEEIPVSIKQKLKPITLNVNYAYGKEYEKAAALRLWIMKNTLKRMAIEWTTMVHKLYADCKVLEFEFSELNPSNVLSIPLSIRPLSPFFDVVANAINIIPSEDGKKYEFTYPYTYGIGMVENNEIINNYIKPIPLIVTLYGEMTHPEVSAVDAETNETYAVVRFKIPLLKNQHITINAVTRKITFFDGIRERDGYDLQDFAKQSFIFAKENTASFLSASVQSDKDGVMEASYRRYRL